MTIYSCRIACMPLKILFIIPYPLKESPSQRFRFEQYLEKLKSAGYTFYAQSFLDSQNWQLFFKPGNYFKKAGALAKGYLKRFILLFISLKYDFVFIHREATPAGPPLIEWMLAKVLRKKIIYDFDDAIWHTDRQNESFVLRALKWRSKVALICKWSYKVSCGNAYLQRYALKYNPHAIINPTTIDTKNTHRAELYQANAKNQSITIGWTGSHSTLKYLKDIEDILARTIAIRPQVQFTVIADQKPSLSFPFTFMPWSLETEIKDLLSFDIGIMPLPDNEWSKGKCGFKILQYMALRIPALASPVGVNTEIIDNHINGFLCENETEWLEKLLLLIDDSKLREGVGLAGYRTLTQRYSVNSNSRNFLNLFK